MDINICDQCEEEKADRKCFDCNLLYCNSCSNLIHNKGKLQSHRLGEVTEKCQKFCQNCDENEVQIFCEDCDLNYCLTCSDKFHKKGKLVLHTRQQVNYKEIPSIKGKKEWENTTYGWYPVPKSEKCEFFNRLLPDFYQNAWKYMSDPYIFKKSFVTEATRQWDIQSRMKKLEGSVNFILGTNPNAVGSFIHGEILKPGQNKILDNNIKKLNTNYASLDELKVEVKDNECEIYDQTGRTLLKEQFTVQHAFNLQMLILLSQLHDRIKEVLQKCDKLRQKYIQLFGGKGRVGRTEIGIRRKKTGHNRRKAIKRNLKHLFKQCSVLTKELCPNLTVSNDEFSFTSNINGLQDICKNKVENETNNFDIDQVCNIGVKFAKALFVLFEKNVFTHTAKCLILENVCDSVEERYWALYESSHECWRQGDCQDESERDSDESESNREVSDYMEDVSESGEEVVQE